MAFRKIKRLLTAGILTLALTGCSASTNQQTEPQTVSILAPTGAPALAMTLATSDMDNITLDYTSGTDLLTAELAKTDGTYDIIVAPVNLGVKTFETNDTYKLAAILTWGNLYMVGTDEADLTDTEAQVALFGEGAIPGMVYNKVEAENVTAQTTWYSSVSEAQQALLSQQAQAALLAEPAVTATIAKGKENGLDLRVLADLQTLWQDKEQSNEKGYPQAALFIKDSVSTDTLSQIQENLTAIDPADESGTLAQIIDEKGADTIGVPNAAIALKSWNSQNIKYVPAADCKADLQTFLQKLNLTLPEGIIAQ